MVRWGAVVWLWGGGGVNSHLARELDVSSSRSSLLVLWVISKVCAFARKNVANVRAWSERRAVVAALDGAFNRDSGGGGDSAISRCDVCGAPGVKFAFRHHLLRWLWSLRTSIACCRLHFPRPKSCRWKSWKTAQRSGGLFMNCRLRCCHAPL